MAPGACIGAVPPTVFPPPSTLVLLPSFPAAADAIAARSARPTRVYAAGGQPGQKHFQEKLVYNCAVERYNVCLCVSMCVYLLFPDMHHLLPYALPSDQTGPIAEG